jgi:hypothetical protein
MIRTMLKKGLGRFERRYGYDAAYMHEIVDADTGAGVRLMMAMGFLNHDFGVPADMVFAAKIRSALRADCGPCLRLVADIAREAGVGPETLLPALGHGDAGGDVGLAIRYADAVLDNGLELAELADEIRTRFGERARAGLAVAILSGQFYPLLKRAMGHAATCEPVVRALLAEHAAKEKAHEDAIAG